MPVIHAICQEACVCRAVTDVLELKTLRIAGAFQPMHFIMLFDELDTDMDMEDGHCSRSAQLLEIGILDHIETVERISAEALQCSTQHVCAITSIQPYELKTPRAMD
eukprot:2588046-Amphidinium_carterae.2